MSFAQLEYFIVVAEEQHLTRAAQRLHISQPPLTRQIRRLEEELGVALFKRTSRGMSLLPCGEIFLREVRSIMVQVQNLPGLVRREELPEARPPRLLNELPPEQR